MTHTDTAPQEQRPDPAAEAALRRARFGTLPERVHPRETVETKQATPRDPDRDAYHPDDWLVRYCL